MKVFTNPVKAAESAKSKDKFYLNSICPYSSEERLCGSRCALFYLEHAENSDTSKTSAFVILGCKAGEKHLYVNELVED